MKSTVETTQIFKYILLFTFLFSAFLALTITYNKVYKLKNETISIFEKYEGVTTKSLSIVNKYLKNSGYNTKGNCKTGWFGVTNLDGTSYEKVTSSSKKYYYCLSYTNNQKIYYKLELFYKFNLPFVGEIITFTINGETKGIKYGQKL